MRKLSIAFACGLLAACATPSATPDGAVPDAPAPNDTGMRADGGSAMLAPAPEANLTHTFPADMNAASGMTSCSAASV